eukprot:3273538-Amphidinium_carterae.1
MAALSLRDLAKSPVLNTGPMRLLMTFWTISQFKCNVSSEFGVAEAGRGELTPLPVGSTLARQAVTESVKANAGAASMEASFATSSAGSVTAQLDTMRSNRVGSAPSQPPLKCYPTA